MKRITYVWLAASILAGVLVSFASAQNTPYSNSNPQETSLGNYARAVRKDKKPEAAKQWDNDNLPRDNKLSVVGNASAAADLPATPQDATQAATAAPETLKMTPGQSQEERQKVMDKWQQKLAEQHAQVDTLSQALDLYQREYRVHAAEYYNDPSQRMSNPQWAKDDADFKQKIADEQKAVEDAKQKFGDMEEEARHSGVPNSVRESTEQQPDTVTQQMETAPQQPETTTQQPESAPQQSESAPEQPASAPEQP
jgi:hypothetical protein